MHLINPERYQNNLVALRCLKEGYQGKAELNQLKNYSGWGGLREAIYTPEIYRELKRY